MSGIRIQLELDDGTFTTRMLHAGESVDQFNAKLGATATAFSRVEPAHRSFIGHMRDIIVIVAAARLAFDNLRMATTGWAADIIKVNAEFERMTYLLRGMSQAKEPMKDAVDTVKQLRDIALETPYSLKAISDTFVKIKATGIDPMQGSLKAVTDTVAAFGGSETQLKRAALALQEMSGKGVVQTKELRRQLGQDIPRAVELMARALGVSQQQLSAIMEKGTLEAKSSMSAMFGEWERTFGGSGKRLMSTFNGLLEQTHTLIQNLALEIGNAGFFDETKKQLKDLNGFLSGNQAKVMAVGFGDAMAAVVRGVRSTIDWVIKFRNEIASVGTVFAVAFATKVGIGSLLSLGTAIGGILPALRAYQMQLAALSVAMRNNNIAFATQGLVGRNLMGQFTKALPAVSGFSYAMTGVGIAARFAGVGLAFLGTYVLPVIAVAVAAAYAFGLFEDKVKAAYEAVKKYGANDPEQMALAEKHLENEERALDLLYKQRDARKGADIVYTDPMSGLETGRKTAADQRAEILSKEEYVTEIYNDNLIARAAFKKRQDAEAIRRENDLIDAEKTIHQREYDEARKLEDADFAATQKAMQEKHQSTHALEVANQQKAHDWAVKEAQLELDRLKKHIDDIKALGDKNPSGAAVVEDLLKQQRMATAELYRAQHAPVGPVMLNKKGNLQDALEKADSIINKLQGDTEKYKAELAGANGELAQFLFQMSDEGRSKKLNLFGDEELEGKIKLAKELFVQMEELKKQAEGRTKYDHDLAKEAEDAANKRFEAENQGKSEADKIQARRRAGLYGNLAPISAMQTAYKQINDAAHNAAVSVDGVLGEPAQAKGRGMLGVLRDMTKGWNDFNIAVGSTKPSAELTASLLGGGGGTPGGSRHNQYKPADGTLAPDYVTDVIRHESGGRDVAAKGSSASGLGQFIEKTWLEFLQDMHPEKMSHDRGANLALRSDSDLQKEAVGWYGDKNRRRLDDAGIESSNSNTYLAHLLGPDGAIAALSKSSETMLRDIPQLKAALGSNPSLAGFNVGELQSWSQSFIRNGQKGPSTKYDSKLQAEGFNTPEEAANIANAARDRKAQGIAESNNKLRALRESLQADATAAEESLDGLDKHVRALKKSIEKGDFLATGKDPKAAAYDIAFKEAAAADANDQKMADRRKTHEKSSTIMGGIGPDQEALEKRKTDLQDRLDVEGTYKTPGKQLHIDDKYTKEIAGLQSALDKGVGDADKLKAAIAALQALSKDATSTDAAAVIQAEQKKINATERTFETVAGAKKAAHDEENARLDQELEKVAKGTRFRVDAEEIVARAKAANARKLAQDTPVGQMFKSWSDMGNNFQQASVGWMNSFSDNLAKMVVKGKVNWKSLADSIIQDMVRVAIRGAIGNLFGSMFGAPVGGGGGGKMGGGGGGGKAAATHHMGGIAGQVRATRMVDLATFAGAQRFHTGGFPGLSANEVPIVAMKGEEVDWPQNLAKKYGGNGRVTNNHVNNVTVNANGGNAAQNQDLAERVGRVMQDQARTMIAGEIRTQMKPGGLFRQ